MITITRRQLLEEYWLADTKSDKETLKPLIETVFNDMFPTKGWKVKLNTTPIIKIKGIHE